MDDSTNPTSAAHTATPRKKRPRKALRVILTSLAGVLATLVVVLIGTTTVNAVATASEEKKIERYGQMVQVDGKRMNVSLSGSGDRTVVLLPGFGTASPVLDFGPIVKELAPHYRVVVVEPFGYGLSDGTDRERTSANIVSEVHGALRGLGIAQYILMGHSIAGIYGLQYANTYPDEVTAFVGIDSSVPTQPGMDDELPIAGMKAAKSLGLMRVLTALAPDPYAGLPYSAATKEQMALLANKNSLNSTYTNEMEHFSANFHNAQKLAFPRDLPVLLFVQADNKDVKGWLSLHEQQAASVERGEVVQLDAEHYLHHTKSEEIAAGLDSFLVAG
ncbi:alpha/beta fold hydrolase [Leifsonia poae]|uniref:alpha/beta fold hydrolase n=1 Tax=Leifsonia poae TaxID=110933 RepID=UPI001CBC47CF|nr:alpha/beta hydrolase [Leifsonia poae]